MRWRKPVVYRKPCITGIAQHRKERRDITTLGPVDPASAVNDDRRGEGSGTFGHERVQCEIAIGSLRKHNIVERSRVGEYGGDKESERESFHAFLPLIIRAEGSHYSPIQHGFAAEHGECGGEVGRRCKRRKDRLSDRE